MQDLSTSDRPIECGQCTQKITVVYQEVLPESVTTLHMCPNCPVLESKLNSRAEKHEDRISRDLHCSSCHTSLESVRVGGFLGCPECYDVFGEYLVGEWVGMEAVWATIQPNPRMAKLPIFHIGKTPDTLPPLPLSIQIASLHEALHEALRKENYEQAAWLRDQINSLKEERS